MKIELKEMEEALEAGKCPRCGGPISFSRNRIPCQTWIREEGYIPGKKNYYCKNPECLWPSGDDK